ncbi:non-ribosomal peptide synthetase [Chitinophaga qingshengii]|uniref:Amino acid adenylation domain-containing protein n=1 Tax=Chitinophaga qingshengii TaxID=1569794 RepID=A0ABR7TWS9_9BACT|nr:non-ribosomal peptide synthetase [Chitinophaga qingshengii]MBC9934892.1 amino acid adenylation domain-containing protein [Chitinophaga qingshengii]
MKEMNNIYQLSPVQRRLMALKAAGMEGMAHVCSVRIHQPDITGLQMQLKQIIRKHDIFRTVFIKELGMDFVCQQVRQYTGFELSVISLEHLPAAEQMMQIAQHRHAMICALNDPDAAIAAELLITGKDQGLLLLGVSATAGDLASLKNVLQELIPAEKPVAENDPPQFIQFSEWHNQLLTEPQEDAAAFWQYQHLRENMRAPYPFQSQRLHQPPAHPGVLQTDIDHDCLEKLQACCHASHVPLESLLMACWYLVLFRHGDNIAPVVGVVEPCRSYEAFEGINGPLAQTLPLRLTVEANLPVTDFICRLGEQLEEMRQWQDNFLLEEATQLLRGQYNFFRAGFSFADVMQWHNNHIDHLYSFSDRFLLQIFAWRHASGLALHYYYEPQHIPREAINCLQQSMRNMLLRIAADNEVTISALLDLYPEEQRTIMHVYSGSQPPLPLAATLLESLEQHAIRSGERIAVTLGEARYTYSELNDKAGRLAACLLHQHHLQPGHKIAVALPRSIDMLVVLIGILKAGCSYIPLDTGIPLKRLQFILEDSKAACIITNRMFTSALKCPVLPADGLFSRLNAAAYTNPAIAVGREEVCYNIYTSGTTGIPKGVEITHGNLSNYLSWFSSSFSITDSDKALVFSSVAFDLTYTTLWSALYSGGTVCLLPETERLDLEMLVSTLKNEKITYIKLTPSHLSLLVNESDLALHIDRFALRLITVGGERIRVPDIERYLSLAPRCRFINHYGPTETTIGTVFKEITADTLAHFADFPVIGRPIANNAAYILNEQDMPVPVGVTGELCISGAGVAKGYIGQPAFGHLYKTGDLARWLPDGNIVFIGRKDFQLKIRGYRVDPEETAQVLKGTPGIDNAVVMAREHESGVYLAAYYTGTVYNDQDLRQILALQLPEYMMPAVCVHMKNFPLTPNGKIDGALLPDPRMQPVTGEDETRLPQTDREKAFARVWAEVLRYSPVSLNDNFLRKGGDSINAIQIVARMAKEGYTVKVFDIFAYPRLADLIAQAQGMTHVARSVHDIGSAPLTPIQARLLTQPDIAAPHHFNQSVMLRGQFKTDVMRKVFEKITAHYDVFRLVFKQKNGGWVQEYAEQPGFFTLEEADLSGTAYPSESLRLHADKLQASLDISTGPLLKACIYHLPDADRLLLVMHHLITDGVSWRILLEDIATLTTQYNEQQALSLSPCTDDYIQWAARLQEYAGNDEILQELPYWKEQERMALQALIPLKSSSEQPERDTLGFTFDKASTQLLGAGLHDLYGTTANDVLLAALSRSLAQVFNLKMIALALEGHGREDIIPGMDVSRTMGWFTSIYPVVINIDSIGDPISLLLETKATLDKVPRKGIGYGILKYLTGSHLDMPVQVSFNYLGRFDTAVSEEPFGLAAEDRGAECHPDNKRFFAMEVTAVITEGQLQVELDYDKECLDKKDVARVSTAFKAALLDILYSRSGRATTGPVIPEYTFHTLTPEERQALAEKYAPQDVYPLSPLQEGLFFHSRTGLESDAYFRQFSYRFHGVFDVEALRRSFDLLIARHDILRAIFDDETAGRPVQVILKERHIDFTFIDLSGEKEQDTSIQALRASDKKKGFDLGKDLLMRVTVLKLQDALYELIWNYHHIIMDGWSSALLGNECLEIYSSIRQGREVNLPPAISYKTYISWAARQSQTAALGYWKHYLAGYDELASLPGKKKNSQGIYKKEQHVLTIAADKTAALAYTAANEQLTVNTLLQVVWAILLGRYTMKRDVVFGAVVSGRPPEIPDIESIVGLFINVIPVRVRIDNQTSLVSLCRSVQYEQLQSHVYQWSQLAEIQTAAELKYGLFDHFIGFENFPVDNKPDDDTGDNWGRPALELSGSQEQTTYDLYITIIPGERLTLLFSYNEAAYDRSAMQGIADHFLFILEQLLDDPGISIGNIELVTPEARNRLLQPQPREILQPFEDVVARIAQQAAHHPLQTAMVCEGRSITYENCAQLSDRLASYLLQAHTTPDEPVAVCMQRSEWAVIALLGILKAGMAFLPIDPAYPDSRIRYILKEAGVRVLLTDADGMFRATENFGGEVFVADIQLPVMEASAFTTLPATDMDQLAYVLFTSGSTGNPKGVAVTRGNINYYLRWANQYYFDNRSGFHFPCFTSLGFDLTLTSIFTTLMRGDTLYIWREGDIGEMLRDIFDPHNHIRAIKLTPSHISLLPHLSISSTAIMHAIVGGEELTPEQVNILHSLNPDMRVYNEYGPTETTVGCMIAEIPRGAHTVTIGKAIAGTDIFIMDQAGKLQAPGMPGEICIGGAGVTKGYIGRPDLTAERFVANTYTAALMYRSGDKGLWLPDGNIAYLGRIDDQLKIRGHRIEPGEVQQLISDCSRVQECIVTACKDTEGADALAAYVVMKPKDTGVESLRTALATQLPAAMMPQYIIPLDTIPLTVNGKIDKTALPVPGTSATENTLFEPPSSVTELKLAAIWEAVLQVSNVGINDNFFRLGGHSLKVVMAISRIHKALGVRLNIHTFFDHPTIKALAELVVQKEADMSTGIVPLPPALHYEVSHMQRRLWIISQFEKNTTIYNITAPLSINGILHIPALEKACRALVERHESLRTTFMMIDDEVRQVIHSANDVLFYMEQLDLSGDADPARLVRNEMGTAFDLEQGPLFRVKLARLAPEKYLLVLSMHHIISDGWSMELMISELTKYYCAFTNGMDAALPPLSIQYKDYAAWQNRQLQGAGLEKHRNYWIGQLGGDLPVQELPVDFPYQQVQTFNGDAVELIFSEQETKILRTVSEQEDATLFMTLLAAVKALLWYYTAQNDLVVGIPVSGRDTESLEQLVGFFVNTLPVRVKISEEETFSSLLKKVKQHTMEAFEHQAYHFDKLVEDLDIPRVFSHSPIFDTLVSLQLPVLQNQDVTLPDNMTVEAFPALSATVSKYHLTFNFTEEAGTLTLELQYNTDLFMKHKIINMTAHLKQLINAIGVHADIPLQQIHFITPQEEILVVKQFNNTSIPYPASATAADIFEVTADKYPWSTALVYGEKQVTYRDLNAMANRISRLLREDLHIGQKENIALKLERSEKMIVVILAILKAGCTYLPVDPALPDQRIRYMLEDTRPALLINEASAGNEWGHLLPEITLDELIRRSERLEEMNPARTIDADSIAYIMYTSGSTGIPKGVMVPHKAMVRLLTGKSLPQSGPGTRSLLTSGYAFDGSVFSIFNALLHGGELHVVDKETVISLTALASYIQRHAISEMFVATALFNLLVEHQPEVGAWMKWIATGGEEASTFHIRKCMASAAPGFRIYNAYGPTENGVITTVLEITSPDQPVSIGKPVSNASALILDRQRRPVPVGIDGELYVGGEGLASGYLNNESLSREKFVLLNGKRYYATGDLGRWTPAGDIVFRGRKDRQLKIEGYRIEPGEIETTIRQHPSVVNVIVAGTGPDKRRQLGAWVVLAESAGTPDLRSWLRERLPVYMIPVFFRYMDALPLTSNGKIDYSQLQAPMDVPDLEYAAPLTETENNLALIWNEVLMREKISIHADFFDIGGHSLKATQIMARIYRTTGVNTDLRRFFENPTIHLLAGYIDKMKGERTSAAVQDNGNEVEEFFL